MVETISCRVVRTLRQLGYLEAGRDDAVATGHDPLRDNEPAFAGAMAASVTQRMAFGEQSEQQVRRIGSGFDSAGERPALKGPRCVSINGFSLHANIPIPAHRRDQLARLMGNAAGLRRRHVWGRSGQNTICLAYPYSLQSGDRSQELAQLPPDVRIQDLLPCLHDFGDMALFLD